MTQGVGLAALSLATEYRTGETDPVEQFYQPCLLLACEYKRAVGFFRSSVFLIVGPSTVEFARRGGHIRLICSPALVDEDAQSIEAGYEARQKALEHSLSEEIDQLLASETTAYRTRVLATLIAIGTLDIRLALRPAALGLYHEKLGLFRDAQGQCVSFLGSANETWAGWHQRGNYEAIEVFCSWRGGAEAERVARHEAYFERLWEGIVPGIEIVCFPEAARRRLIAASLGSFSAVDVEFIKPHPKKRSTLPYQSDAIEAWKRAGRRGIFEHATGSGKTFTALLIIQEHISAGYLLNK